MLTTKEQLFAASSAGSIISKELAEELFAITKNRRLKELLSRDKIIVSASLRSELQAEYDLELDRRANAAANRKGIGGRKRLPDLTPEDIEKLPSEERLRYNNRIWQRNSRARRRLAVTS